VRRPAASLPLLLLLAASRLSGAEPPALERSPGSWLVLTRLPPVLAGQEVRKHLETGLTTTLAFHARTTGAGGKTEGAARVDVRYELWDEVYLVTRADVSGSVQRATFSSFEQLARWWRDLRLAILEAPPPGPAPGAVEVRLRVIPFSQSEQLDAQRWFSRALAAEEPGGAGPVSQATEDRPETFRDLLNLLIATSLRRPALIEYEWALAVPPEGGR
jgi:hypothetical protein